MRIDIAMSLQIEGFIVLEALNADEAVAILDAHDAVRPMFTYIGRVGWRTCRCRHALFSYAPKGLGHWCYWKIAGHIC